MHLISSTIILRFFSLAFFLTIIQCQESPQQDTEQPENTALFQLKKIGNLPSKLKESSGLALDGAGGFWSHNDRGNKPALYQFGKDRKLVQTVKFKDIPNIDWEELTEDDSGYLYIGDFGNTDNKRKDLVIYKIKKDSLSHFNKNIPVEKILYTYADQQEFPPNKKERHYDVEAMFYCNDFLYLLTKDQSKPSRDSSRLYQLPSTPGIHSARHLGGFQTKGKKNKGQITSAAISPDGKTLAVASNEEMWLFSDFSNDDFFSGKEQQVDLSNDKQFEAIVFEDNCTIYLTCEKNKEADAGLYRMLICKE